MRVSECTCIRIDLLHVGGAHVDACVRFVHVRAHIYGCV